MENGNSAVIQNRKNIDDGDRRRIVWGIIQVLQEEELSYQQAVELLNDTKVQLKNIPIKISNLQ